MRILHVIHSVDSRSGGPSAALRATVRYQRATGHEVHVLATTAQSAEPWASETEFRHAIVSDPDLGDGVTTLLHAWGRRGLWSRYAYTPAARRWLLRRFGDCRTRPEVVHIHGVFSHLTTAAAHLCRHMNIPYVLRPAGSFIPVCFKMGRSGLKSLFLHLFLKRDLSRAAAVHATSSVEAYSLSRLVPRANVVTIPHGVSLPNTDGDDLARMFYSRHPHLFGTTIVLFLARVHPIKRPSWVVEAVARLASAFPDLFLVAAGNDAGAMAQVQETVRRLQLGDRCLFPGFLRGEEKEQVLAAADVFVLPSISENFGVAVVEAMAHGVPVVVTPGVAAHEYVDAAGCGFTVEDSIEAVAEGIRKVLQSDRDELGRRGREYVARHLTWPVIVGKLDELYRKVLRAGSLTQALGG